MTKQWKLILSKLNEHRDRTQIKFTVKNTPPSLYWFWVNYKN